MIGNEDGSVREAILKVLATNAPTIFETTTFKDEDTFKSNNPLKYKNIVILIKWARLARDQQISVNNACFIYSISLHSIGSVIIVNPYKNTF